MGKSMQFFDIGANLTHSAFAPDLEQTLERARRAGVEQIVATGTTVDETMAAIRIAERFGLYAKVTRTRKLFFGFLAIAQFDIDFSQQPPGFRIIGIFL